MEVNMQGVLVFEQDLARIVVSKNSCYSRFNDSLATVIGPSDKSVNHSGYELLMCDGTVHVFYSDEFVVIQSRAKISL